MKILIGKSFVTGIEPPQLEWQIFAHVSEDEFRLGMSIKYSRVDDPHGVSSGFDAPCPGRADEIRMPVKNVPVIGSGRAWMNIERHIQLHQSGPERVKLRFIQVVPVRMIIDQSTAKSKIKDAAT